MLREYMLSLGYTSKEIDKILNTYPLFRCKEETLYKYIKEKYTFFINFGYSKEQIIKMTVSNPSVYSYGIDNIKNKIIDMLKLGYTEKKLIKMSVLLPVLYGYSIDNIRKKMDDMKSLGYTNEQVVIMTAKSPFIYSLSISNIKNKIKDMVDFGYSYEEIMKMGMVYPTIYTLSIEKISDMINKLVDSGYDREQVFCMSKRFPSIYGYSMNSVKIKSDFYEELGLSEILLVSPKQVMQSIELSYARYMYFKSIEIYINMENYRLLFMSQRDFKRKYGKSNKELIEEYNYQEYLKDKDNSKKMILS